MSRGRRIASSRSRQNAQSRCSSGVGVRSPRPDARPARVAARHRRAVEASRRRRPRRARASGGASARRGRATAGARRPRRSRAPGRTGTRAGRAAARARAATRADGPPRRRRGSRAGRARARRASGTSGGGGSPPYSTGRAAARVGAELLRGPRPGDDRRDRRRARARTRGCSTCTPTPTTTARSSRVVGAEHRARRRRCSRRSRSRASGSTCAGTRARTRGSAPPTWSRSCRSGPADLERARQRGARARRADRRARAARVPLRAARRAARRSTGAAALEELQRRLDAGELAPDFGPARLDPSAGAVHRRRAPAADRVQRQPARRRSRPRARSPALVRESGGGFPGVRALGLELPRAGLVQVSMNVEDWEAAALHEIVARIAARGGAARGGGGRLRARRPDARRRRRRRGRRGAPDRRLRRLAHPRAAPARRLSGSTADVPSVRPCRSSATAAT